MKDAANGRKRVGLVYVSLEPGFRYAGVLGGYLGAGPNTLNSFAVAINTGNAAGELVHP